MINVNNSKQFCKNYNEIENYDEAVADTTEMWVCHHIMEEVFTQKELIRAGWYYNRNASELIFIRMSEHNGNPKIHIGFRRQLRKLHEAMKGRELSEEHKRKLSEAKKCNKGKARSEETKMKISNTLKGKNIGRHWYNNGVENVFTFECPDGFVKGVLHK